MALVSDSEFLHDYDLASLNAVRARGQNFSMQVTPRFRHHYERTSYDAFTSNLISRVLKRAKIFVDVGAHYGFFTLLAAAANPSLRFSLSSRPRKHSACWSATSRISGNACKATSSRRVERCWDSAFHYFVVLDIAVSTLTHLPLLCVGSRSRPPP